MPIVGSVGGGAAARTITVDQAVAVGKLTITQDNSSYYNDILLNADFTTDDDLIYICAEQAEHGVRSVSKARSAKCKAAAWKQEA